MEPAANRFCMLVCEDDDVCLELLCDLIRVRYPGSRVLAASNGQEGLELFREELPDMIITDVQMPLLDGVQMCREIQKVKPEVKTIIVSAFRKQTVEEVAEDAVNVDFFLTKPLAYQHLFNAIDECREGIQSYAVTV